MNCNTKKLLQSNLHLFFLLFTVSAWSPARSPAEVLTLSCRNYLFKSTKSVLVSESELKNLQHYTKLNEPGSQWEAHLWFQIISVTLWLICQQGSACVQSFLRDFVMHRVSPVLVLCSVHVKKVIVIIYHLNFLLQPARNKSTWHLVSLDRFCVFPCKKAFSNPVTPLHLQNVSQY